MPNNNETKVRFNLWAVLGFLVLLGALGFGYLFSAQSEDRVQTGVMADRVTRLEANYIHIGSGINDIKTTLEKVQEELVALRIKTSEDKPSSPTRRDHR